MTEVRRVNMLGLPLDTDVSLSDILGLCERAMGAEHDAALVTFINPFTYYVHSRQPELASVLERFALVLSDGVAVRWSTERLFGRRVERSSFDSTSLSAPVLRLAAEKGWRVVLVGGADGVAARAAEVMRQSVPGLNIVDALSGYASWDALHDRIIELGAQLVVCGMGAPRQELFLAELARRGWRGCGFTCGGYLDQLAGGWRYYPEIVDRLNLRFLYRLWREPRRLWRRYMIEYQVFALGCARALLAPRRLAAVAGTRLSAAYTTTPAASNATGVHRT